MSSNGKCYAYYDGQVQEDWGKHAEDVLSVIDSCFKHEARIIANRVGAPYDYVLRPFRLSAALHDIGKIMNIYQMQRDKYSKINYYGHEIIGAYLVDRCVLGQVLMSKEVNSDVQKRLRVISLMPIMMHHHAMRSLMDWWVTLRNAYRLNQRVSRWLSSLKLSRIEVCEECLKEVKNVLQSVLENNAVDAIVECLKGVSFVDVQSMIKTLNDWYAELTRMTHDRVPREYLLMLGPLVVADNLVAHRNRARNKEEQSSILMKELDMLCPNLPVKK